MTHLQEDPRLPCRAETIVVVAQQREDDRLAQTQHGRPRPEIRQQREPDEIERRAVVHRREEERRR